LQIPIKSLLRNCVVKAFWSRRCVI